LSLVVAAVVVKLEAAAALAVIEQLQVLRSLPVLRLQLQLALVALVAQIQTALMAAIQFLGPLHLLAAVGDH
jgi:hypothetical protein